MSLLRWVDRFLLHADGFFPKRWRLPVRWAAYRLSGQIEPEMRYLNRLAPRFRTAVDVGANHGLYAYQMAQCFEEVYAFEANAGQDFDLWHVRRSNVHAFPYGLSNSVEETVLRLPLFHGRPLVGWASVLERALPFAEGYVEVPTRLERLDDQPFVQVRCIDLIKVDVEGHELQVLQGAEQILRRDHPVLILEDNVDQRTAIEAWLGAFGYRQVPLEQLIGKALPSPNRIWMASV